MSKINEKKTKISRISIDINTELGKKLNAVAIVEDRGRNQIIEEALELYFEQHKDRYKDKLIALAD